MIVIASHVNYALARDTLLQELKDIIFDMREVVVVIAGESTLEIATHEDGYTQIKVPINFWELTPVYGVYAFMDDPRVKRDYYIMIHDTSTVQPMFQMKCREFIEKMRVGALDVLYASKDCKCNIAGLSRAFIQEFGPKYNRNGTKNDAYSAEGLGEYSFKYYADTKANMKVGVESENGKWCAQLMRRYPNSDIYRCPLYYSSLDMYKVVGICEDINPPADLRTYP